VEGPFNVLSDNDVKHCGAFAIDKFRRPTASPLDPHIDIERRRLEGDLGTIEFNFTCARLQPERRSLSPRA
jgi:hypothetical protein